mmetsp:Transcript_74299/g.177216  ORF Transcript_74299/g.177216 Transcript_74299/m.177216 type:complete len:225 (-) Transcript_74299:652-1326(-)
MVVAVAVQLLEQRPGVRSIDLEGVEDGTQGRVVDGKLKLCRCDIAISVLVQLCKETPDGSEIFGLFLHHVLQHQLVILFSTIHRTLAENPSHNVQDSEKAESDVSFEQEAPNVGDLREGIPGLDPSEASCDRSIERVHRGLKATETALQETFRNLRTLMGISRQVLRRDVGENQAEQEDDERQQHHRPHHGSQSVADGVEQRPQGADELHQPHYSYCASDATDA